MSLLLSYDMHQAHQNDVLLQFGFEYKIWYINAGCSLYPKWCDSISSRLMNYIYDFNSIPDATVIDDLNFIIIGSNNEIETIPFQIRMIYLFLTRNRSGKSES